MNSPRVYGLDLNGGDIGAAATVRIWYLEFLERESIHDDPYVRILPMNAWEAATAVLQLMEHSVEDGMGFESGLLAQAFDEMNECLQQPKPPWGTAGWRMC